MNVGIVSVWFNRGQAVVSRQVRSILNALGHNTHVLARRTKPSFIKPHFVDNQDVWKQDNITHSSAFEMGVAEYLDWAIKNQLDMVFFDQNLQFEAITALRKRGILTVGRFVWESFGPDNVESALAAFDCIYSLTKCEQERYKQLGIESPYIQWGCHPELLAHAKINKESDTVTFFYPAGYLSKRKPTIEAVEAFCNVDDQRARLIIKAQHDIRGKEFVEHCKTLDARIQVIVEDLPTEAYLNLFSQSDVSLAPSRWEGLGLHLYEAVAFGIPTITNNAPPMNEHIGHGENGLLIESSISGYRRPGVPVLEPNIGSMTSAMNQICDDSFRAELGNGVLRQREQMNWSTTISGYANVIERLSQKDKAASS